MTIGFARAVTIGFARGVLSPALLTLGVDRYSGTEGSPVIIALTWGSDQRYARLTRWQMRVLQRWADEELGCEERAAYAGR